MTDFTNTPELSESTETAISYSTCYKPSLHLFPYAWTLKDALFTKDKGKVFSCFACGGGSTMGYKLAGFDVIGHNDIDTKMMEVYKVNHNPKYSYHESITTFAKRKDLPKELYDLDILDGSPPCSSFSMAGNREKDWGKEKVFKEGQSKQVLDTLFFDFIDLAKELQPKVVVAENVKGLLQGNAKSYVIKIYKAFEEAGYYCQHWLLDSSVMGVPQKRERVFFIAKRKDLAEPFLYQKDMFTVAPKLKLEFNEKEIPYKEIEEIGALEGIYKLPPSRSIDWDKTKPGQSFGESCGRGFTSYKINKELPLKTINTGFKPRDGGFHYEIKRALTFKEISHGGTFPLDYNYLKVHCSDVIGMSVPPVMTAQISTQIYEQWLSKAR
jgi:DNA (cytosine-5)-methyltransferase 1